jgi:hypothetical protein
MTTTTFHLAQVNLGRLRYPLDDERMAEFVEALGPINEAAEASPGFVWRLTDDSGQSSSYVEVSDDPLLAINLSVWQSPDALRAYVHRSEHVSFLRRRREWFQPFDGVHAACWWVPAGHIPTVDEALERLAELEANGPTERTFDFRGRFPDPPSP